MRRPIIALTVIVLLIVAFFVLNLSLGTIAIPFDQAVHILFGADAGDDEIRRNIIQKSRYPQTITALVAGAGLPISGLQMQMVFRNPLAGPSELGTSSGVSSGVTIFVLLSRSISQRALVRMDLVGEVAVSAAAFPGALLVVSIAMMMAQRIRGNVVLLITGVMIGYIANAIIDVLKFFNNDEDMRSYVIWGLGSFAKVSGDQVTTFVLIMPVLIPLSFLLIKVLNLMLPGENYARSLGLNYGRARHLVIFSACLLTVIMTVHCGPIVFIELAVPHLCRTIFVISNHLTLMPAVMLVGAFLALCCNSIARVSGMEGALPISSVMTLIGTPIVIWVLSDKRCREQL